MLLMKTVCRWYWSVTSGNQCCLFSGPELFTWMILNLWSPNEDYPREWRYPPELQRVSGSNLGVLRVWWDSDRITPKSGSGLLYMIPEWELSKRVTVSSGTPKSLRKQSRSAKSLVRFRLHHSKEWLRLADAAFFGWNSKGITETWGVLLYDCHLAVCVYPPLWNLWSPNENYPREWRYPPKLWWVAQACRCGFLWVELKKDYRDFGAADLWSSFGRLCISTPMESMIPKWELLSKRVTPEAI